ncbi:MAG: MFS transporter [Propionibacteriaceae bacterium]|nr:MFS transporter [Propionibacteriaceae bacterium]
MHAGKKPGFPPAFWFLAGAHFIAWIGRFVTPFLTVTLTESMGFPTAVAGIVVGCYGAGVLAANFIGGMLTDRLGGKPVLVASFFLAAAALCLIPLGTQPVQVGVALVCFGVFNGASNPAVNTLAADMVDSNRRVSAFAALTWAMNLGYAIGPVLGGFLSEYAYWTMFATAACLMVTAGTFVWIFVKPPPSEFAQERKAAGVSLLPVFSDKVFMIFVATMALYSIVYMQSTTSLPLVMTGQGFSLKEYGYLISLNGALLCFLQPLTLKLLRITPRKVMIMATLCFTTAGLIVQAYAVSLPAYAAAVCLWTFGELGLHPTCQTIAVDLAPAVMRGRYQGIYGLNWSMGLTFAPMVGSALLEATDRVVLWWAAAAACVSVAVIMTLTARGREVRIKQVALAEGRNRSDCDDKEGANA